MKIVLIDIDGTLLDSQKRKDEFFALSISMLNNNFPNYSFNLDDLLRKYDKIFRSYTDGRRNDQKLLFTDFLISYRLPSKVFESALNEIIKLYWDLLRKSQSIPEASSFLNNLVQNGFTYILYSDSTSEETNFKLNLFPSEFFPQPFLTLVSDSRYCNNTTIIPLGKNKSLETYLFLKKRYNVVAMVGDSEEFDIIPALSAGIHAFNSKNLSFNEIFKKILKIS